MNNISNKNKLRFYACKGGSFTGKSTWAKQESERIGNCVIIEKDLIRKEMGADLVKGIRVKESKVIQKRNELIMEALEKGQNIISSDTNLGIRVDHIKNMKALVYPKYREQYNFEVKDFTDVPFDAVLERVRKTDRPEGSSYWEIVVREQKEKFMVPRKLYEDPNYYYQDKRKVTWFDLDGTLAIMNGRSPFDFMKSGEDLPNLPMIDIAKMFCEREDVTVIILSGRSDICREVTENWLSSYEINYDFLYMRKEGDYRKDTVIKKEIFDAEIADKYLPYAVFDDRRMMVEMWAEMGLPLFAFGNPYHTF